ncbi:MAG: hypothetical protein ACRCZ2_08940 [Fusobacteriaceae bacterium]
MDETGMIREFNFMDIVEDDGPGRTAADLYLDPEVDENADDGWDGEKPEWLDDENFDLGEEEANEEEEENSFGSTLEEIASNFDTIDDDTEFTIHGETITKADIASVVRDRADLKEAREGIEAYVGNLGEVEMRISTYLQASMTETETRLRQVELMLERPETMTPTEVQKALVAQRDLRARQGQLEQNAAQVRGAEEERRQQLDLMKINQTNATLRASLPDYKGIQTLKEVATWAQKEGIPEADLRASMSPAMIRALMDAKLYREKVGGKKQIREAAAKRVAPKSVSAKPKSRGAIKESNNSRAYEKAMKAGDTSSAFNFLTD